MIHQTINSKTTHYSGIVYESTCFSAHFHNSYELIYIISGCVSITVGGETVKLCREQFILISPCVVHEIHGSDNSRYFIGIITPDYIPEFSKAHTDDIAIVFRMDNEERGFVQKNLIEDKKPDSYRLRSCLYMVISFADKGTVITPTGSYDVAFSYGVNSYIAKHFADKLTRKSLAEIMGYEEHYFSCLFHRTFGMSIPQYLTMCRISYACRLLQKTNHSILAVALDCGFSSIRTFNSAFLKQTGQTPSDYRKKCQNT